MLDGRVLVGDCRDRMAALPERSVDAVVTDPPYGLEFMGKEWDRPWAVGLTAPGYGDDSHRLVRPSFGSNRNAVCRACRKHQRGTDSCGCSQPDFDERPADSSVAFQAWTVTWATEAFRVLKPGGHLVAFGGSRTWHRLASAIEDAGFEVRDSLMWVYGSGFPKSLDVSKAIDKHYGRIHSSVVRLKEMLREEFEASDKSRSQIDTECGFRASNYLTVAAEGKRPDPWANVLPSQAKWQQIKRVLDLEDSPRVGILDAAFAEAAREVVGLRRVAPGVAFSSQGPTELDVTAPATPEAEHWDGWGTALKPAFEPIVLARKPLMGSVATNVLAHGTGALNIVGCRIGDDTSRGDRYGGKAPGGCGGDVAITGVRSEAWDAPAGRWPANLVLDGEAADLLDEQTGVLKSGANPTRRGSDKFRTAYGDFEGQSECVAHRGADEGGASRFFYVAKADEDERPVVDGVAHPTVKPLALMRWLIRLVTPPGGVVLDPFLGSGTTAEAALLEGFDWLGCERGEGYLPLIQARLDRFAAGRSPGLPQPRVRPQVPGQIDLFSSLAGEVEEAS